jgi:hypothetical protein
MIIVNFELLSAIDGCSSSRGIITISNIKQVREGNTVLADYEVRAYPKRTKRETILAGRATPHRTGKVIRHPKHSVPVWDLMAKALGALGYG